MRNQTYAFCAFVCCCFLFLSSGLVLDSMFFRIFASKILLEFTWLNKQEYLVKINYFAALSTVSNYNASTIIIPAVSCHKLTLNILKTHDA